MSEPRSSLRGWPEATTPPQALQLHGLQLTKRESDAGRLKEL
ncbi:MAG TPA: hypothetical protein VN785_11785 [Candidatus Angelobacter sp.]|nr:hypothetical protein [Candidatus Angelobacter sp.]